MLYTIVCCLHPRAQWTDPEGGGHGDPLDNHVVSLKLEMLVRTTLEKQLETLFGPSSPATEFFESAYVCFIAFGPEIKLYLYPSSYQFHLTRMNFPVIVNLTSPFQLHFKTVNLIGKSSANS